MKVNKPFQALIASLNLPGKGEIIEVPDRGVIGEIKYGIPETVRWEDLDLRGAVLVEYAPHVSL
jgi:hypothetical protein